MDAELHCDPTPPMPARLTEAPRRPGGVLPMTPRDIPTVARLFSKTFRSGKTEIAPELAPYLEAVFFVPL